MNIGLIFTGLLNFEIFFILPDALDGITLYKFTSAAIEMHKRSGGRSEIRYAVPSANTVVFWDISLKRQHFAEAFRLLKDTLAVTRVAIHPGKCNVDDTSPCVRIAASELKAPIV